MLLFKSKKNVIIRNQDSHQSQKLSKTKRTLLSAFVQVNCLTLDHPENSLSEWKKISKISMVLHSSCWKSEAALPLSNNFLHFLQFLPGTVFSLIAIFPTPSPPMKNLFLPFQVRLLFLGKRSIFEEFNSSKSVWNRNLCGASALQQVGVQ